MANDFTGTKAGDRHYSTGIYRDHFCIEAALKVRISLYGRCGWFVGARA